MSSISRIASMSGSHLAAESQLDRRRAAAHAARHRARPRRAQRVLRLLGAGARHSTRRSTPRRRRGSAEVYLHEMPGGQYTNLKEQAAAMGLGAPLAGDRAHLRRGEPALRRHREGHAVEQGRRRHGALPLHPRHQARRRGESRARHDAVSGERHRHAQRRARRTDGRLADGGASRRCSAPREAEARASPRR